MDLSIATPGTSGASHVWSGASAPMSPTQKMSSLFSEIDPSNTGTISQAQFLQAFQTLNPPPSFQAAGADAVWTKLDPSGSGSVSKQDFVSEMTTMMKQLRGHHHHHGSAAGAQALAQGASALEALGTTGPASTSAIAGSTSGGSIFNALA